MLRIICFLLTVLILLGACTPAPPSPVPVPSDWIEVGGVRLPAQVFAPHESSDLNEAIVWEKEPVALVWEGGWPRYREFVLPEGLRPVDVAFLDVGGRVQEIFVGANCPLGYTSGCVVASKFPAASVVMMEAGLANQMGLRGSTLVRVKRSDKVSEIETLGIGPSVP